MGEEMFSLPEGGDIELPRRLDLLLLGEGLLKAAYPQEKLSFRLEHVRHAWEI
jgi:hypothetical protein